MIMKKQSWMMMFKVFSMINSSSRSSCISFNYVVRRRRQFCSTTTTTNTSCCLSTNVAQSPPPPPSPPPVSNMKHEFNMLLEKKLPLLIVPYDHISPKEYVLSPPRRYDLGDYNVCDGTFGFINLFHDDGDDDELIINKKKKKNRKVYDVYVPEIAKRRICGSSEGWLGTAHHNGEFQLLNPVTRVILHLPHVTALPTKCDFHIRDVFIHKVVTNTTTTTTNSTTTTTTTLPAEANTVVEVMVIYGELNGSLAYCRTPLLSSTTTTTTTGNCTTTDKTAAAAASWIKIPFKVPFKVPLSAGISDLSDADDSDSDSDSDLTYEDIDGVPHKVTMFSGWEDVTFYKGNFYTVDNCGMVGVVKGLDGGPSSVPFAHFLIDGPYGLDGDGRDLSYLVESGTGDLLMVIRSELWITDVEEEEDEIFERPYRTTGFRVSKLDLNNNGRPPSWGEEEVTDLGDDCALFIGYNHSFSFSASKIPGCRGNCIYFTDNHCNGMTHYLNGGHDIGVYNLKEASFDKLNYLTSPSQLFNPNPVWYVPN